MGAEALIATAIVTSVASGAVSFIASEKQAKQFGKQAKLQKLEAAEAAENTRIENLKFKQRQKLAFLKNGVSLSGSPLVVLAETELVGNQQVRSIIRRGAAQSSFSRSQAQLAKGQGRAALLGSIGSAATSGALLAGSSGGGGKSATLGTPPSTLNAFGN